MATSRYIRTRILGAGTQFGTNEAISTIRRAIANGSLQITKQIILRGDERLDTVAGVEYGDGRYWWILAAASNIGWGLQAPPGTLINVLNLKDVLRFVG